MPNNIKHISVGRSNLFLLKQLVNLRLLGDLKKSFLGWVWLVIAPLITILIWILIKTSGVLKPGEMEVSYVAFIILSTTVWFSFFDTYKSCSQLFLNYAKILLVNKLPIFTLIISEVVAVIIKFCVPMAFILIYYIATETPFHYLSIFSFFIYLCLILFGASIGLFVGLFNSISKDFTYLADNIMRLLMFVSPVVYVSDGTSGLLAKILNINILTYFFDGIRGYFFFGEFEASKLLFVCCGISILIFYLVSRFFIINTPKILERGEI